MRAKWTQHPLLSVTEGLFLDVFTSKPVANPLLNAKEANHNKYFNTFFCKAGTVKHEILREFFTNYLI